MLKKVLLRIKLPEVAVNFILNLYKERKIKVVTSFRLTEEFEAKDGIDQGEVISPLVWRIFYDPLLCAIQKARDTGYKIMTRWLENLVYNTTKEISHQQAMLAYADDTTWIARSKEELQKIINTANEFYALNDIEINSKKSELLVFNANSKAKEIKEHYIANISMKEDKIYMKKDMNLCRYLGVWISNKDNLNYSLNMIRNEINRICKAIR